MGFDYELGFKNIVVSFAAAILCLISSTMSHLIKFDVIAIVFVAFAAILVAICLISIVIIIYAFLSDMLERLEDKIMEVRNNGKTKRT